MCFSTRALVSVIILCLPAVAAASSATGIDNFHVVDQNFYRGAQPTDQGFAYLAKLGVRVVLDLREHKARSVAEQQAVTALGMRYVNIPITGLRAPTESEVSRILQLLEDPASGPVFVHCRRGAQRTGTVTAAYRIDHDGWDNARALKEANANGMSWWQFPRRNFIMAFQKRSSTAAHTSPATADLATVPH